jgi:hypothetical protein
MSALEKKLMTTTATSAVKNLDGFDSFDDSVEGEDEDRSRLIQGERIKFTNEATWVLASNGEKLPADLELVVCNILRVVQKWPVEPGPPLEEHVLLPGEKVPDLKKRNEETPQSEWREGPDGQMHGPWQFQYVLYLFAEGQTARYTWCTGTIGGAVNIRELAERTNFMRKYKGAKVYPVVTLSDAFMQTRFGGRQRPNFIYKRWVEFGGSDPALPAGTQSQLPPAAQQLSHPPIEESADSRVEPKVEGKPKIEGKPKVEVEPHGTRTVSKPTAKEVTGDEIKY